MFTEGLDRSARRWASASEKENSLPRTNLGARADPVMGTRKGSNGLGLPAISRFQSGHLPTNAIPLTRIINGDNADDTYSVSDSDMVTDSEEEVSRKSYSLDSSPPNERAPVGPISQSRNRNLLKRRPHYGSDPLYSDVSSSVETLSRMKKMPESVMRGNGRYPVEWQGYEDDELSDSLESSEFSTTQTGSINGVPGPSRPHNPSSLASQLQAKSSAEKGSSKNTRREESSDEEIPSAPPLCGSVQEMNEEVQVAEVEQQSKQGTTIMDAMNSTSLNTEDDDKNKKFKNLERSTPGAKIAFPTSHPPRLPIFHASALGPWHAVIAYDACVRLCLNAWARGCDEAPMFLEDECLILRNAFGVLKILLRSEEELLAKQSSKIVNEGTAAKTKKIIGKIQVQVRKVKTVLDPPTGCGILSVKSPSSASIRNQLSNMQSTVASQWRAVTKVGAVQRIPRNSSRYIKQVAGLLKTTGVTSLRNSSSSYEVVQETFTCLLRLKSSTEEDVIPMKPGSGETHVFFPDNAGDDLIIEVKDSKAKHYGRVLVQVATVSDEPGDKLRWWSMYREPEHEVVGKIQLCINYSTSCEETNNLKYGTVAETVAYDLAMEVAMKVEGFQQRKLLLDGPWKWLLQEFASYYGISAVYTKLRYLSYIMDVATPTADCLTVVYDLLMPVVMKGHTRSTLSHQENRILGEVKDQIEQILAQVFENYKSLDEALFSGIMDIFQPATGVAAPALDPAVKLYTLLHDVLSPEAQNKLCQYFQVAAKKRSRRHLSETDEYVANSVEGILTDTDTMATAYQKMASLCTNLKNEIFTDIEIHSKDILPSFVDLPNLTSPIYATELSNRLCAFLTACPPSGPSPPVAELIVATADFQRDIVSWKISPVKGGVNAKELFNLYILVWIQDKRVSLLEICKLDKIKWSGVRTQHSTTPFLDDMYDRLREMLSNYEVIICRWPEYIFPLENAIGDVEKAIMDALDKQYMDVLAPLKENITPKKFGFKYVQKLTKRSVSSYTVPPELGILLNSMKRMLDVLHPRTENQFRSWASFMPNFGNTAPGDRLSEVAVMLRTKFRNYLQAIIEKLAENTKMQAATKMKKILQDSKGAMVESDVRGRMQPLKEQLTSTINHLHGIFANNVFVAICRGYWDKMGKEVLSFLESRKENRSWYKGSQIAVLVLDDTFASQMQQLLGNAGQPKDLEPPNSIMEVRSILCKDAPTMKNSIFY